VLSFRIALNDIFNLFKNKKINVR